MKALVLGCGQMGQVAIEDLAEFGNFDEIIIGDIDFPKAEKFAKRAEEKWKKVKFFPEFVDVTDYKRLVDLMRGSEVVLNCVGPFYRSALSVADAAIEAKVSLVDICDDYDVTTKVLELDRKAKEAGITIVSGMGVSPGVTNVLAKAGSELLDSTEEIHTAWVIGGSDVGGIAETTHELHAMYGKVPTFQDGKYIEVRAFIDGREKLKFPEPVGECEVFHVGHPEPITIPKYIKGVKHVDNKGCFKPSSINEMIVKMGEIGLLSEESLEVMGMTIKPLDFAAAFFLQFKKGLKDAPKIGAIRVEVRGMKGGKRMGYVYSATGTMAEGTGICTSVGTLLLARGEIEQRGSFPPEGCIDPFAFLDEISKRPVAQTLSIEEISW